MEQSYALKWILQARDALLSSLEIILCTCMGRTKLIISTFRKLIARHVCAIWGVGAQNLDCKPNVSFAWQAIPPVSNQATPSYLPYHLFKLPRSHSSPSPPSKEVNGRGELARRHNQNGPRFRRRLNSSNVSGANGGSVAEKSTLDWSTSYQAGSSRSVRNVVLHHYGADGCILQLSLQ